MRPAIRSLNLATTAGIVLYEAVRQVGIELEDAASVQPLAADSGTNAHQRSRETQ